MLFDTSDPKLVQREIKKLQPLTYNRFRWWRRFDTRTQPLPRGAKFIDRIKIYALRALSLSSIKP
jgi:hypothetical protein